MSRFSSSSSRVAFVEVLFLLSGAGVKEYCVDERNSDGLSLVEVAGVAGSDSGIGVSIGVAVDVVDDIF